MSFDSWTCLVVSKGGGLIPDELVHMLKMSACKLHAEKRNSLFFSSDQCDGLIVTSWEEQRLNTRSGVLFSAEAAFEELQWQINFLLNSNDLERGAEILRNGGTIEPESLDSIDVPFHIPIEQLYNFRDLRPRTFN